jgi:uncharacterized protein involved in exopolysaccharide biosynthesis
MFEPVQIAANLQQRAASTTLRKIASVLFRRKLLITGLFVPIFLVAALVTMLSPRQYESRMKVLVKNGRTDLVVSPDPQDAGQMRTEVTENLVNSEIGLLSSNDLLSRVVRSSGLYEQSPAAQPESFELAVRKLAHALTITPVRKSNIIQVTYRTDSPHRAATVLKALSTAYLDEHLNVHRTPGSTEFFRTQMDLYQSQLRGAQQNLTEFRLRNGVTSIAEQEDLLIHKAADSETALREVDATLAGTRMRMRQLRTQIAAEPARIVTQSRTMPNQTSVERLNTMLAELENRRTELITNFRSDDRVVVEVEQQIANTRNALNRAAKLSASEEATDVNPLRQSLESDLAQAEIQEADLEARREVLASGVSSYRARLAHLEAVTADHNALQRTLKEAEENYLLYAKKEEEARIGDSLDQQKIANVAIIEAPVEQHLPANSGRSLNLALGGLLATLVSLATAFVAERPGSRIYTAAELCDLTHMPVLASIPYERHTRREIEK